MPIEALIRKLKDAVALLEASIAMAAEPALADRLIDEARRLVEDAHRGWLVRP